MGQGRGVPVVQVQGHGDVQVLGQGLHDAPEQGKSAVFHGAGGGLDDHRSPQLLGGGQDALGHFHIFHIKGADGVTVLLCVQKQFLRCCQGHKSIPPQFT